MSEGYKPAGKKWGLILTLAIIGAVGAFALSAMKEDSKPQPTANAETPIEFGQAAPPR